MPRKAVQIKISPRLKGLIEKELNRAQLEGHYAKRLSIIYHSATGMTNQEVGMIVGCLDKTVRKWRNRLKLNEAILKEFEQGHGGTQVKDKELMGKLKEIISDIPRPGAPSRITELEITRLQALACEHPEKYGLPFTVWTHEELSNQAKKMGIEVSPAHCGRLLKKTN
jgi:putative transposase